MMDSIQRTRNMLEIRLEDAVERKIVWIMMWRGARYGNAIEAAGTDATDDELFELALENAVESFREIRREQTRRII